jgi:hypothetical protein
VPTINARIRAACLTFNRPQPARRPRLPGFNARDLPSQDSLIHLLTARQAYAKGRRRHGLRFRHAPLSSPAFSCGLAWLHPTSGHQFRLHARLTHHALFGAQVSISLVERQTDRIRERPFDEYIFHFTCGHVATTKGNAMDFQSVSGVGTEWASERSFDVWCIDTWRNQENAPWIAASTPHARGQWDRPMRVTVLVSHDLEKLAQHSPYLPLPSAAAKDAASLTNTPTRSGLDDRGRATTDEGTILSACVLEVMSSPGRQFVFPQHVLRIGSGLSSAPIRVSRSVALCKLIPRRADEVRAASGSGARQ